MRSTLLTVFSFIFLTYCYLYPGSQALLEGRTDTVMGDGTDSAPMPYSYDLVQQVWKHHPSRMFFGSVYLDNVDPEQGSPLWLPWNERWLVVLAGYFVPLEQVTTAYVVILLLLNGLCMFLLGNYLRWPHAVSVGLAIAWAFNCFTRARAKVHLAMAGIYHLPLIFLGLYLVARGKSKRSLVGAAFAFLAAATVAHYFLITSVFISPIFLAFFFFQPELRGNVRKIILRLAIAVTPAVLFLGWNYLAPVPSYAKISAEKSTRAGLTSVEEHDLNFEFLNVFYARGIDYFAGDISLQGNGVELNPLRDLVNSAILSNLGQSNPHERTNGIRWVLWALAFCAVIALTRGHYREQKHVRNNILFFLLFAMVTAWLSFAPDVPLPGWGLSHLQFSVFPKVRVAARSGIMVHFSVLMLAGLFLSTFKKWRKIWLFPGIFGLVLIVDYPPLQQMPMSPVAPAYVQLQRERGPCGLGMAFPFFSPVFASNVSYLFSQRMRGSDCATLNLMWNRSRTESMTRLFPPSTEFLNSLTKNRLAADALEKLARCVPLNWIVFHEVVPAAWASQMCQRLGWTLHNDLSCIASQRDRPLINYPENCL